MFIWMKELIQEEITVDLLSIKEKIDISNSELIDIINFKDYSYVNKSHYANLIKNQSKKVDLIRIAEEMMLYANTSEKINGEVFNFANKLLSLNTMGEDNYSMEDDVDNLMNYLEERKGKELFWYSWGEHLSFLNKYTKGIQKWRTYRIGAPSNLWKTWLGYNIINNLLSQDCKVAFFTLENDKSFTLTNLMANKQQVNSYLIEDWTVKADVDYIKEQHWKLFIIDDCYEINDIFTKCLEIKPDVVILDYIWLIQIKKTKEDDKYTEYSKLVQWFVKKSRVGWIDLSNLPKGSEDEDNIRTWWGFYWSSFLKNNTDVWIHMFYHKPFYEYKNGLLGISDDQDFDAIFNDAPEKDKIRNWQVAHLFISKNRIGTAKVESIFKIDFNKWWAFSEVNSDDLIKWWK